MIRRLQLIPSYSQSSGEASTQSKTRMLAMNSPAPQQQWKITLNSPGVATAGASGDPRVNQNKPGFSRNLASTQGNQVVSTGTFILTPEHSPFIEHSLGTVFIVVVSFRVAEMLLLWSKQAAD